MNKNYISLVTHKDKDKDSNGLRHVNSWEPGKLKNVNIKKAYFDPEDMLNNFCFHVYAQKSLFIDEKSPYNRTL